MLATKVPPPIVALLCGAAVWVAGHYAPWPLAWPWARPWFLLLPLLMVGGGLDIYALFNFIRVKTTANPMRPEKASRLVISGPYRYTRNPMYLGLALNLSAWALYLNHAAAWLAPVAFVLYITQFQIKPEERALLVRFGADYAAYTQRVRRWL